MKKLLVAFVAVVAVSFASCGGNTQANTEDSTACKAECQAECQACACDSCECGEHPCTCDADSTAAEVAE